MIHRSIVRVESVEHVENESPLDLCVLCSSVLNGSGIDFERFCATTIAQFDADSRE